MLLAGTVIHGKYAILRRIGEGGMGTVYEALNLRLKRRVAIKVMRPRRADELHDIARFEREAQAAARVGSRHVVGVLDIGELPNGDRFLVMEHLDGESLD